MTKRKNIILFITFLVGLVLVFGVVVSFGQKTKRPPAEKRFTEDELYVTLALELDSLQEEMIFCGPTEVKHFLSKRRLMVLSKVINLDLKVVKRHVGKYDSWIGRDEFENYYYITPMMAEYDETKVAILFQPCDKRKNRVYDRPYLILGTVDICNFGGL